jgi:hypothetical protein
MIMDDDTFGASLDILRELKSRETQAEVNLNGNGESMLDPKIYERIEKTVRVMGDAGRVQFCTNATMINETIAKRLKDVGLKRIDVSVHDPYHARRAVDIFLKVGLGGAVNQSLVLQSHNWAGQLEPEHSIAEKRLPKIDCDPLIDGRGYIQAEGAITPCCYDYKNLGVFGTVFDDDILERYYGPYDLCFKCHQVVSDAIWQEYYSRAV